MLSGNNTTYFPGLEDRISDVFILTKSEKDNCKHLPTCLSVIDMNIQSCLLCVWVIDNDELTSHYLFLHSISRWVQSVWRRWSLSILCSVCMLCFLMKRGHLGSCPLNCLLEIRISRSLRHISKFGVIC